MDKWKISMEIHMNPDLPQVRELSLAVEVKSDFMLEGLEDLSAGCRFTGNEILKIDI